MVDTNSPEFYIGKKIGYALMTYVIVRLIIKGVKIVLKSGRVLISPTPMG